MCGRVHDRTPFPGSRCIRGRATKLPSRLTEAVPPGDVGWTLTLDRVQCKGRGGGGFHSGDPPTQGSCRPAHGGPHTVRQSGAAGSPADPDGTRRAVARPDGPDPGIRGPSPPSPRGSPVFGITSNTLLRSSLSPYSQSLVRSSQGRAGRRRIRRLWAGTRSCGPEPEVYDYRGLGTPSHPLGQVHPYVRSYAATGTDRERSDWRRLACGMDERPKVLI